MFFMFRLAVPLLVLIHVNIKLLQTLRTASRDRAQLTRAQCSKSLTNNSRRAKHHSQERDYFTTILVSVVSVFIVCQLPDFLLRSAVTIKQFTNLQFDLHYFNTLTNMLLTLNSSINCLVYCLTGTRFRKILARQVCKYSYHQIDMGDNNTTKQSVLYVHETTI